MLRELAGPARRWNMLPAFSAAVEMVAQLQNLLIDYKIASGNNDRPVEIAYQEPPPKIRNHRNFFTRHAMWFEWKSIYLTGNQMIDRDHMKLFEFANEFYEITRSRVNAGIVEDALLFLLTYMEAHCFREEKEIEKLSYPYRRDHIFAHNCIRREFSDLINIYEIRGVDTYQDILIFLKVRKLEHIINYDADLKNYIENNYS